MAGNIKYDDKYIKAPNAEYSYSVEEIRELNKCKEDPLYFIRNYVKIVSQDKGVTLFEPYEYQMDLIHQFQENRYNICLLSRQSGKCLLGNTNIRIRNKNTEEVREILMEVFYDDIE